MKILCLTATALTLIAAPTLAQIKNTAPTPLAQIDTIPAPKDIPYPGTMIINLDATDTIQGVLKVQQTIPLPQNTSGPFTLLFPKWLPGKHGPRGEIEKLAGLKITANGKPIAWTRDPIDVFAFHLNLPQGVTTLNLSFQFLTATKRDQGRVSITPDMMNIEPEQISLYPAGYYTRQIPTSLTVTWPQGWTAAGALRTVSKTANTITYETTDYETLVDSPFFAGKHFKAWDLGNSVTLNVVADAPRYLEATPEQITAHKNLVTQSLKTFGAKHFDHYDFLLALTEEMGGIGLEHHRSSENGVPPEYFTEWDKGPGRRNLLPHEFVHSWNGKYRRGADAIAADFRAPIKNTKLWVYEGQTQFWGYVLGARSGITSQQDTLDSLANIAASLNENRPARDWRPLIDTTNDPVISARAPKAWVSQQRSEDYYNEGLLIWLETDAIIREQTKGKRGIDDFAKAFFGVNDGDWGVLPYDTATITKILNDIAPYDWEAFFDTRLNQTAEGAPLNGFTKSGYTLTYSETPSKALASSMAANKYLDLTYSSGLTIAAGKISQVIWGSPAFTAGLKIGDQILAVGEDAYTDTALKQALIAAKSTKSPLKLIIKAEDKVRTTELLWTKGLRYPTLTRTGKGPDWLLALLTPRD